MFRLPFEFKPCPQECGKACGANLSGCPTYQKLPPQFQEVCQKHLHLLQYLHSFPMDEYGTPEYYEKLNRSLKGVKNPNLIYRASPDIFIHVLPNPGEVRDHYIPIEPSLAEGQDDMLDELEDVFVGARRPPGAFSQHVAAVVAALITSRAVGPLG